VTEALDRIAAFERDLEERLCTRSERCRFGTAFFHERFPRRWVSNFVWVDASLEGVDADDLAADAEDVLGRAGLAHRVLWIEDLAGAQRLAPRFAGLGYRVDRNVVLVHAREPDRRPDGHAEEIDVASAKRFSYAANLESEEIAERTDAQMLADFRDVLAERVGARFFGVGVDGEVVSGCELYRLGDIAQIEDVYTLTPHRGRGFARAAVLSAVRAARDAGADLIFLGADDEDWPKHLYAKIGFDEVGRSIDFVRKPDPQRT